MTERSATCLNCGLPITCNTWSKVWPHDGTGDFRCADGKFIAMRDDTKQEAPPAGSGSPVNGVEEG